MNRENNNLEKRTITFSKDIISFCQAVKNTPVTQPMIRQLVKSATSIGANYAEANNASSKTDFKNKIYISKKEAAETKYWLELFGEMEEHKIKCRELWQECHYILMTLQKTISTLNKPKTDNR